MCVILMVIFFLNCVNFLVNVILLVYVLWGLVGFFLVGDMISVLVFGFMYYVLLMLNIIGYVLGFMLLGVGMWVIDWCSGVNLILGRLVMLVI